MEKLKIDFFVGGEKIISLVWGLKCFISDVMRKIKFKIFVEILFLERRFENFIELLEDFPLRRGHF